MAAALVAAYFDRGTPMAEASGSLCGATIFGFLGRMVLSYARDMEPRSRIVSGARSSTYEAIRKLARRRKRR